MAQYPPPPSADRPTGARPGAVTAAAVLLFVDGGFAILGALLLFALSNIAAVFTILAVVELVIGALAIFAGVQCLALKASGQRIGVILDMAIQPQIFVPLYADAMDHVVVIAQYLVQEVVRASKHPPVTHIQLGIPIATDLRAREPNSDAPLRLHRNR